MTDLQKIQLDIMLVMTGICAVITLFVFFTNAMRPRRRYVLFWFELSATLVLIFDRIALFISRKRKLRGLVGSENF